MGRSGIIKHSCLSNVCAGFVPMRPARFIMLDIFRTFRSKLQFPDGSARMCNVFVIQFRKETQLSKSGRKKRGKLQLPCPQFRRIEMVKEMTIFVSYFFQLDGIGKWWKGTGNSHKSENGMNQTFVMSFRTISSTL